MTLALVSVALVAGVMACIRLAPVDVARWHLAPEGGDQPTDGVQRVRGGASLVTVFEATPAAEVLARLDAMALITPHTRRIAGAPEAGLITWETRSAFWGFPDYTTAEAKDGAKGATLRLFARQRFGSNDYGVNAARLVGWLQLLRVSSAAEDNASG
jgi:Protein of unknown function (DUF1499)